MELLSAAHIRKTFRSGGVKVHAVRDASFSVSEGEIAVVIDKSGAGKSTLLNILGGLLAPDEGEVKLCGVIYTA